MEFGNFAAAKLDQATLASVAARDVVNYKEVMQKFSDGKGI
jgi:hypothetical protein